MHGPGGRAQRSSRFVDGELRRELDVETTMEAERSERKVTIVASYISSFVSATKEYEPIFASMALICAADFFVFLKAKFANSLRTWALTHIMSSLYVRVISSMEAFFFA